MTAGLAPSCGTRAPRRSCGSTGSRTPRPTRWTLEQQASQAHAGERGGYQPARLEQAQSGLPAALLEFTYQDGETWHALELGVRSPRHHVAMAIHARDRDWGSGWALFEAFKASFVPPAA